MSKSIEQRKTVEPNVLMTALLDEAAERLLNIQTLLKNRSPKGLIHSYKLNVTTDLKLVNIEEDLAAKAFSISLRNDGPDDLYLAVNRWLLTETPIKPGEPLDVDYGEAKISFVVLKSSGRSNVRLWVGY